MSSDPDNRPVTNRELKSALLDRPTRWEMRALLAAAVAANQLLPVFYDGPSPSRATLHLLTGIFS